MGEPREPKSAGKNSPLEGWSAVFVLGGSCSISIEGMQGDDIGTYSDPHSKPRSQFRLRFTSRCRFQ